MSTLQQIRDEVNALSSQQNDGWELRRTLLPMLDSLEDEMSNAENWFLFDNPGNDVIPSAGTTTYLSWVDNAPNFPAVQGGPNPFDLTAPTTPVVLADGNYSFSLQVNLHTLGGDSSPFWGVGFVIDPSGLDREISFKRAFIASGLFDHVFFRRFLAAGTQIRLYAYHGGGLSGNRNTWLTGDVSWSPV